MGQAGFDQAGADVAVAIKPADLGQQLAVMITQGPEIDPGAPGQFLAQPGDGRSLIPWFNGDAAQLDGVIAVAITDLQQGGRTHL